MKKISVVVPCYNDGKSVQNMYDRITTVFSEKLGQYDYEIIFSDDGSKDNTRQEIERLCAEDKHVKALINAKNFGFTRNVYFALTQGRGDAVFMTFGDLQDPPELLPKFVEKWEQGYKVVMGQKNTSKENKLVYFLRSIYYRFMGKLTVNEQVEHYNGFGLYDISFIEVLRDIKDQQPYLKGIVAEYAFKDCIIQYEQRKSVRKSNFNFIKYYDVAMMGITSYTKTLMRLASLASMIVALLCIVFSVIVLINKLVNWDTYPVGTAAITIGIFFLGAVQLFFIGVLGEYVLSVNSRSVEKPLVVLEKKINFEEEE